MHSGWTGNKWRTSGSEQPCKSVLNEASQVQVPGMAARNLDSGCKNAVEESRKREL